MGVKPLVEVRDVTVKFKVGKREITVLKDVSLTIREREIIALIGESGCGKSTLGKVVLGLIEPAKGQVLIDGEDIWAEGYRWTTEKRRSITVIYQDPFAALNPVRTVYQTLSALMRYIKGVSDSSKLREEVRKLLETVGLTPPENFMDKYPFQLSGGQRQRVCIARALIPEPKLIVADEPVSGLDASSRINILDLMRELNERYGIAFLYITHDLATAKYFAAEGRMVVMYLGRIVEEGKVRDCVEHPAHPYARALLTAVAPTIKFGRSKAELPLRSFDVPSLFNVPSGCAFHPRCPYADELCEREEPTMKLVLNHEEHYAACHHLDKVPIEERPW